MDWKKDRPSHTTSHDTDDSKHLNVSKKKESVQRGMIENLVIGCFPKRDDPIKPSIGKRSRALTVPVR